MSKNNIDGNFVDEPLPCVYGPPSWYNSNGTFDRSNPEVKEFLNEIEENKERNRKQKEICDRLQEMVDKPIENIYGPESPIKPEYVDKPIAKVYGPAPSVARKKPTFFSRLFGFFKKEP